MTAGLIIGAVLFIIIALAMEKNALWLPVIVLVAAAAANAFAGVI